MLHGTPVLFALPLAIAPPKLCLHNVALCLQKWRIITLCKIAALPVPKTNWHIYLFLKGK